MTKRFTVKPLMFIEEQRNGIFEMGNERLFNNEIVRLLNNFAEENEQLKQELISLRVELDTHKHPLWSTREAERKVSELTDLLSNETKKNAILLEEINLLRKENMRLKEVMKYE